MTISMKFTVQDVSDGPAPIDVLAVANADEPGAIVCNTEGKVQAAELRLQLDEDSTKLKAGDTFTLSGHFQG